MAADLQDFSGVTTADLQDFSGVTTADLGFPRPRGVPWCPAAWCDETVASGGASQSKRSYMARRQIIESRWDDAPAAAPAAAAGAPSEADGDTWPIATWDGQAWWGQRCLPGG